MSQFTHCFPGDNGNVVCQHLNGSWIVFPGTRALNEQTSPSEEEEVALDEEEES